MVIMKCGVVLMERKGKTKEGQQTSLPINVETIRITNL